MSESAMRKLIEAAEAAAKLMKGSSFEWCPVATELTDAIAAARKEMAGEQTVEVWENEIGRYIGKQDGPNSRLRGNAFLEPGSYAFRALALEPESEMEEEWTIETWLRQPSLTPVIKINGGEDKEVSLDSLHAILKGARVGAGRRFAIRPLAQEREKAVKVWHWKDAAGGDVFMCRNCHFTYEGSSQHPRQCENKKCNVLFAGEPQELPA